MNTQQAKMRLGPLAQTWPMLSEGRRIEVLAGLGPEEQTAVAVLFGTVDRYATIVAVSSANDAVGKDSLTGSGAIKENACFLSLDKNTRNTAEVLGIADDEQGSIGDFVDVAEFWAKRVAPEPPAMKRKRKNRHRPRRKPTNVGITLRETLPPELRPRVERPANRILPQDKAFDWDAYIPPEYSAQFSAPPVKAEPYEPVFMRPSPAKADRGCCVFLGCVSVLAIVYGFISCCL